MSSEPAIRLEGVGKCYRVYDRPHHRLLQMLMRGRRAWGREFWALRDVGLEIMPGETVGIVGRNGSGKSTLLQVVCGTLHPGCGSVRTRGRIAALLELGSGFNPEFSGRENVYLNAALLGLSRREIDARFADIAAFAEIGDFIEQPVKTYSSGMVVRLAFAVMAHVDADILVIDEALAVGDAVFVQKCMRFIRAFRQRGTLLFVSHDMQAVASLCGRAVWLEGGRVALDGDARTVAQRYLRHCLQAAYGEEASLESTSDGHSELLGAESVHTLTNGGEFAFADNLAAAQGFRTGMAELLAVGLENLSRPGEAILHGGERVAITVRARANRALARPILGFLVNDRLGQALFGENSLPFTARRPVSVPAGACFSARFVFRLPMLPNGEYAVFASVAEGDVHDNVQHHLLHDALIVRVSSSRVRWGLVGIPFEDVSMVVDECAAC